MWGTKLWGFVCLCELKDQATFLDFYAWKSGVSASQGSVSVYPNTRGHDRPPILDSQHQGPPESNITHKSSLSDCSGCCSITGFPFSTRLLWTACYFCALKNIFFPSMIADDPQYFAILQRFMTLTGCSKGLWLAFRNLSMLKLAAVTIHNFKNSPPALCEV